MTSEQKHLARIRELEVSLEEANETLRAIRSGEVDALVVDGSEGPRIFTLQGADHAYRIFIEQMHEGALTLDPRGFVRYANQRFAQMAGVPLERAIGSPFRDYVAVPDLERFESVLANGHGRVEISLSTPGGEIPVLLGVSRAEADASDGFCCIVTDLSDQKRAEEIHRSEILFRGILEQASEAVLIIDSAGRITYASRAAHQLAGGNVLLQRFDQAFPLFFTEPVDGITDAASLCEEIYQGRILTGNEAVLRPRDENPVSVLVSAGPITNNEIIACRITLTNITGRKRAEAQLRESQKLESIGLLAGGVAHDFNNLLTGILGNASLIADRVRDEVKRSVEDIISASQRAADLTRQLLAYSGRGSVVTEKLDISAIVKNALPLILTSTPDNARIRLELCADPPLILADRSQIQQVVTNLVMNAVEAVGNAPGNITVATIPRLLDKPAAARYGVAAGSYMLLRVSDTGCGIDDATLSRIFDPFFTTKFVGRGLGLAAVQGIVRSCGGAIHVESRPGEGSTFTALFPAMPIEHASVEAPANGKTAGVVLVADDEPVVRAMASMALSHFGYKVITAEDGREAVERLAAAPDAIDVVLLDVKMPVMGGNEALRQFRLIRPGLKVLVSSGYNEDEALRAFDRESIAGFVQKPYTAAALAEAIGKALKTG